MKISSQTAVTLGIVAGLAAVLLGIAVVGGGDDAAAYIPILGGVGAVIATLEGSKRGRCCTRRAKAAPPAE